MKISADMRVNNTGRYNNLRKFENEVQNGQYKTSNSILNNSLSEAIGRSCVVSFSGVNKMQGAFFKHDCSEFFGDKEHITYNKENGNFVHTVYSRNGTLKQKDEFYLLEGKEISTKIINGIKSVITETPDYATIEKWDEKNRQIYYDYSDCMGNKKNVVTDFKRNRQIIKFEHNGINGVQVIDLKTGSCVTDGEIVLSRYFDRDSNSHITKNVITGQVVKTEKYRPNGKIESIIEYSDTDSITRNLQYDEKTGGYIEYLYRDDGTKKSITKISKNGREIEEYKFAQDGKTEVSHVLDEYARNKEDLQRKTTYIPGTNNIYTEIEYEKNSRTEFYYDKINNVPQYGNYFINEKLAEEFFFWQDGKTMKRLIEYNEDGSRKDTSYNQYGARMYSKDIDSDDFVYCYSQYDTRMDNLYKKTQIDKRSGYQTESIYYNFGTLKRETIKNEEGEIKKITNFYKDGETPKTKKVYYDDGSYIYTKYDEYGNIIDSFEYSAESAETSDFYDGYSTSEYGSFQENQQSKEFLEDEFMNKILDNLTSATEGNSISDISDEEWKKLSKYLGVDDKKCLVNMDRDTYRHLAKRFHPDLQPAERKEACETIFKVIAALYSHSQSAMQ